MAQRQFRSDDTDKWLYGFGGGGAGDSSINTSTDAPIDSACSGTAGTTSLTATNVSFAPGQLILIHQTRGTGVGNWELNKIASYSAGTITTQHNLINTYTNSGASVAQVLVMTEYNDLTINSGQTLTAKAWNGTVGGIIAKFVKGTCTVTGNINAVGQNATLSTGGAGIGFRGGNSPTAGSQVQGYTGEGSAGASAAQTAQMGNGGGGGKAGDTDGTNPSGYGGGGGYAVAGTTGGVVGSIGSPAGGVGGAQVGAAALTSLYFGGGGGGGGASNAFYAGGGGGGGGIVLIIAAAITISGTINVNGGNGFNNGGGGNGAGAGGSVLIKAKTATLGTNLITSSAGTGTASSVGRIHLDYKTSTSGSTTPTLDATQDLTLDYPAAGGSFLTMFI